MMYVQWHYISGIKYHVGVKVMYDCLNVVHVYLRYMTLHG